MRLNTDIWVYALIRRAHQGGRESAAAEVRMHDQQTYHELVEKTLVVDDEAADDVVDARDCDAPIRARFADKSAARLALMDSFVQRTDVLKIATGSSLDYRHDFLPEVRNP